MDNERIANFLNGAFVRGWKVKKIHVSSESNPKWIKLSEIKTVYELSDEEKKECDGCYFSTYKDCIFITGIEVDELLILINKFLFKPDDFYYDYMES